MTRDMRKFYGGIVLGIVLSYLPKMFPSTEAGGGFLDKIVNFLPDLAMKAIPDTITFMDKLNVGSPTLLTLIVNGLVIGLILMFAKK